jgi:hypothetical protein
LKGEEDSGKTETVCDLYYWAFYQPEFAAFPFLTIEKNIENTAFWLYFFTVYYIIIYRFIGM